MIELLVVCAIIVVITAVILVDNNKFGGAILLENLAYDVALTVRQAQVYGIAVERFGQNTNVFNVGYGMYFSTSDPTHYYLFADSEGTGIYDSGASPTEVQQKTTIQNGYAISSLCAVSQFGGTTCTPMSEIDILFQRPEPNAFISAAASGAPPSCVQSAVACYYEAQITLLSPKGDTRTVIVDATGQISVK
ncbi:MAG TPA: hypothetical protein VMH91_01860 [Candidatus Paceibacterota bacterium]|nr:hypothetical protein [Candidatus Paceibacterota bacterium]